MVAKDVLVTTTDMNSVGKMNTIVSWQLKALERVSCSWAENALWTVVLSFETREIDWKGAGSIPVISDVQESMAVPSDHCENMLMT